MFFDFEAAFPSISWEFMWYILEILGAPQAFLYFLQNLYMDNRQFVKLRAHTSANFATSGGVKQGCPLSPLIFAVCVDVLLRRIVWHDPQVCL